MKFPSKRNRPDYPVASPRPKIFNRKAPLTSRGSHSPADYMARRECVATSKNKLRKYWVARMKSDGHPGIPEANDPELRYSELIELARTLGYDTETRKLPQEVRTLCKCARPAIAGGLVCRFHGGSTKQVINAARERIMAMIDPSLDRLGKIIKSGKHEPAVVAAIKDVLDRAGLKKPDEQAMNQGYSEEMITRMADIFTESELDEFIRLHRKLQAGMPEPDEDGPEEMRRVTSQISSQNNGDGTSPIKTITVDPREMARMIKSGKKFKEPVRT